MTAGVAKQLDRLRNGGRMLILGLHGFIGTHVALAARAAGYSVSGLSLAVDIERSSELHKSLRLTHVTSLSGDATDPPTIRSAIDTVEPDVLVNAVGVIRTDTGERWLGGYNTNIHTASATIDGVASLPSRRRPFVIWVGSQAEYGLAPPPWSEATHEEPATAYGASKAAATALVLGALRSDSVKGCVVRLPIVYGEGQAPTLIIARAICDALSGTQLEMTAGEQRRRFLYGRDVGNLIAAIAAQSCGSIPPLINAPASEPTAIRDVIAHLVDLLPDAPKPILGALNYRDAEALEAWPDTSLADSLSLIDLTPLDEALQHTVHWYQSNMWFVDRYRGTDE